jgi:hypothetical protein
MNYYLFQNNQQIGPYTEEQLRQALAEGQIQGTDFAWREGLAEWAPLSTILPTEKAPESVPIAVIRAPEPEPESEGRNWPKIIGITIGMGVLLLGAAIAFLFWEGSRLDASSKAYVDNYVSTIAPNWSADDFVNRTAPANRDQIKREAVDNLFSKLSTLGNFKSFGGSQGEAHIGLRNLGRTVTARYQATATFEQGDATFDIVLLRVDGQWTIAGLRIDSPLFHH